MERKLRILTLILILTVMAVPAFAGGGGDWVSSVIAYHNAGRSKDAQNTFNANYSSANLHEAGVFARHGLRDMAEDIYRHIGSYAEKSRTQAEAWFRLGEIYAAEGNTRADSYFSKAIANRPGYYDAKVVVLLKKASKNVQGASAACFHENAISHAPNLRSESAQFYMTLGDKSSGETAAKYYQLAGKYASGDLRQKAGKKILALGVRGNMDLGKSKKMAVAVIGNAEVENLVPSERIEVLLSKTYRNSDAVNDKGWIYAIDYSKLNLKANDLIIISGDVPSGADVVYVVLNKQWKKVPRNNLKTITLNRDHNKGKLVIWVDSGVVAKVEVVRKTKKEPDYALLMANVN